MSRRNVTPMPQKEPAPVSPAVQVARLELEQHERLEILFNRRALLAHARKRRQDPNVVRKTLQFSFSLTQQLVCALREELVTAQQTRVNYRTGTEG